MSAHSPGVPSTRSILYLQPSKLNFTLSPLATEETHQPCARARPSESECIELQSERFVSFSPNDLLLLQMTGVLVVSSQRTAIRPPLTVGHEPIVGVNKDVSSEVHHNPDGGNEDAIEGTPFPHMRLYVFPPTLRSSIDKLTEIGEDGEVEPEG